MVINATLSLVCVSTFRNGIGYPSKCRRPLALVYRDMEMFAKTLVTFWATHQSGEKSPVVLQGLIPWEDPCSGRLPLIPAPPGGALSFGGGPSRQGDNHTLFRPGGACFRPQLTKLVSWSEFKSESALVGFILAASRLRTSHIQPQIIARPNAEETEGGVDPVSWRL